MDRRLAALPLDPAFFKCPSTECPYEDHGIFKVLIRSPDGRQRYLWACAEHLPVEVGAAINDLRLKPPPDL